MKTTLEATLEETELETESADTISCGGSTPLHFAANWRHQDRYCPRSYLDTVSKADRLKIVEALIEDLKLMLMQ